MKIEIDQSGKIEDTARPTVLAYSNSEQYTVLIPASVKRKLQELYRRFGEPRLYIYQVFAIGIFFLLRKRKTVSSIVIDTEYPGKDEIITNMLRLLLVAYKLPDHVLRFARIGSHPRVHYTAKDVFDEKIEANQVLTAEDVVFAIKKTDGRLRECFSTLVDAQVQSYRYYTKKSVSVNYQIHQKRPRSVNDWSSASRRTYSIFNVRDLFMVSVVEPSARL